MSPPAIRSTSMRTVEVASLPACDTPPSAVSPQPRAEPDYQRVFDANPRLPDLRGFLEPRLHGVEPAPLTFSPNTSIATKKLDEVQERFAGPYRVPGHGNISAPPTFHSPHPDNGRLAEQLRQRARAICEKLGLGSDLKACFTAYPLPDQLVRVTQALIDNGELTGVSPIDAQAIRDLQAKFHIGVHCMGYVRASQIALHGTRWDNYSDGRKFVHILKTNHIYDQRPGGLKAVAHSRPGDVLHLDESPMTENREHNVVVRQRETLMLGDPRWGSLASSPHIVTGAGPVHMLEVVQSGGGDNSVRGVRREIWLFNEDSGAWASFDPTTKKITPYTHGPQDHTKGSLFTPRRPL